MGLPAPETPQDVSTQQDEQTPEIEHGYPKSPFKEVTFSKPTIFSIYLKGRVL